MSPIGDEHTCIQGAAQQPATEGLLGTVIGDRYEIESYLQKGGMGAVYRARHLLLGMPVAMKVILEQRDPSLQKEYYQRFRREARLASQINHPNIIHISDFGVLENGQPYLVMEYLQGRTLFSVLRREGVLAPLRACRIAAQVAAGMQAAHERNIVHRDLKPENIFLVEGTGQDDFVKIIDFGIARDQPDVRLSVASIEATLTGAGAPAERLTQPGYMLGTAEFMAPEQLLGENPDHRADQYALGCILYEMLTGSVPFQAGENALATAYKHVIEPVVPPRQRRPDLLLPEPLERVVLRAMAKKPEERFPSMRELEQALLAEAAQLAGTRTQPVPAPPPPRARWLPLALSGMGTLACALGLYATLRAPGPGAGPPRPGTAPVPDMRQPRQAAAPDLGAPHREPPGPTPPPPPTTFKVEFSIGPAHRKHNDAVTLSCSKNEPALLCRDRCAFVLRPGQLCAAHAEGYADHVFSARELREHPRRYVNLKKLPAPPAGTLRVTFAIAAEHRQRNDMVLLSCPKYTRWMSCSAACPFSVKDGEECAARAAGYEDQVFSAAALHAHDGKQLDVRLRPKAR